MYASELCESYFAQAPEVLDSINMVVSIGKFIFAMLNPIVFFIPVINKPVIGLEAVGINDRVSIGLAFNYGQ